MFSKAWRRFIIKTVSQSQKLVYRECFANVRLSMSASHVIFSEHSRDLEYFTSFAEAAKNSFEANQANHFRVLVLEQYKINIIFIYGCINVYILYQFLRLKRLYYCLVPRCLRNRKRNKAKVISLKRSLQVLSLY